MAVTRHCCPGSKGRRRGWLGGLVVSSPQKERGQIHGHGPPPKHQGSIRNMYESHFLPRVRVQENTLFFEVSFRSALPGWLGGRGERTHKGRGSWAACPQVGAGSAAQAARDPPGSVSGRTPGRGAGVCTGQPRAGMGGGGELFDSGLIVSHRYHTTLSWSREKPSVLRWPPTGAQ